MRDDPRQHAAADARPLGSDPGARRRRDDDQLPRSDGARHRRAVPDEGSRAHRRRRWGWCSPPSRGATRCCRFPAASSSIGSARASPTSSPSRSGRSSPALMGVVRLAQRRWSLTRIGVGVFEAPCFPANSRILATWFPQHERARANSVYSVGHELRPRLPQRAAVLDHAAVRLARPVLHRRRPRRRVRRRVVAALSQPGREHDGQPRRARLHRGGRRRRVQGAAGSTSSGATSRALLRHRQVLGASLGQFGGNSTQVFFVTWFPTYLVTARGMTFIQAGLMTSLPYIARVDGRASSAGSSRTRFSSAPDRPTWRASCRSSAGMLLASTIVARQLRARRTATALVILIMSIAFFGQGMTNLGWTVVSDIAPKKLIGLTGGHLQLQRPTSPASSRRSSSASTFERPARSSGRSSTSPSSRWSARSPTA